MGCLLLTGSRWESPCLYFLPVTAFVATASAIVAFGLKAAGMLRVSDDEELEGLDIHEHGTYGGYPELALGVQVYPPARSRHPPVKVVSAAEPGRKVLRDS